MSKIQAMMSELSQKKAQDMIQTVVPLQERPGGENHGDGVAAGVW